jgi:hypothetical protein
MSTPLKLTMSVLCQSEGIAWRATCFSGLPIEGHGTDPLTAVQDLKAQLRLEVESRMQGAAAAQIAEPMPNQPNFAEFLQGDDLSLKDNLVRIGNVEVTLYCRRSRVGRARG